MPLDPNILLQRTTPNLMQALQSSISAGQSLRQAPILEALQKQRLQQEQQQQAQQAAMAPLQEELLRAQIARQQGPGSTDFIGTPQRIVKDGKNFLVGLKQGPNGIELSETEVTGEFVSPLGETGAQQTQRSITEAAAKAQETVKAKDTETRQQEAIQQAISAAPALVDINRGLELLDLVDTGGLTANSKAISSFFGATSGDVGELNKILATDMLNTIQSFPGSLSEGELSVINSISASLSQGKEVNKRILGRLKQILNAKVSRGKRLAQDRGDIDALDTIEESLSFGGARSNRPAQSETTTDSQGGAQAKRLVFNPATGRLE